MRRVLSALTCLVVSHLLLTSCVDATAKPRCDSGDQWPSRLLGVVEKAPPVMGEDTEDNDPDILAVKKQYSYCVSVCKKSRCQPKFMKPCGAAKQHGSGDDGDGSAPPTYFAAQWDSDGKCLAVFDTVVSMAVMSYGESPPYTELKLKGRLMAPPKSGGVPPTMTVKVGRGVEPNQRGGFRRNVSNEIDAEVPMHVAEPTTPQPETPAPTEVPPEPPQPTSNPDDPASDNGTSNDSNNSNGSSGHYNDTNAWKGDEWELHDVVELFGIVLLLFAVPLAGLAIWMKRRNVNLDQQIRGIKKRDESPEQV